MATEPPPDRLVLRVEAASAIVDHAWRRMPWWYRVLGRPFRRSLKAMAMRDLTAAVTVVTGRDPDQPEAPGE